MTWLHRVYLVLVNFCSVSPEFNIAKGVQPLSSQNKPFRQIISDPLDRLSHNFHVADYESNFLFLIAQGSLPWQPILVSKLEKSAYSHLFVALAFGNNNNNNNNIHICIAPYGRNFRGAKWIEMNCNIAILILKVHLWWSGYIVCKFEGWISVQ